MRWGDRSDMQSTDLKHLRHGHCSGAGVSGPYQHTAVVVDGELLGLDEFVVQVLQERAVEGKLALQGAIRDTTQALQHSDGLRQDLLECHNRPSACLGTFGLSPLMAHLTREPARTLYESEPIHDRTDVREPRAPPAEMAVRSLAVRTT